MKAFVLPADPAQPGHVAEWHNPVDLLPLMRREIGSDYIDYGRCVYPDGELCIWVSGLRLLDLHLEFNDRAIGIARGGGWDVPALAGTAFITGGCDEWGEELGIPDDLLSRIVFATRPAPMSGSAVE